MTTAEVKFLLNRYGITPRKAQGQHFLLDESVVEQMVAAAEVNTLSTVLEIGPGLGVLTRHILNATPKRLLAVEQDRVLTTGLESLALHHPQLELINQDIRRCNLPELGLTDRGYVLISNLPYSIGSWVLRQIVEHPPRPVSSIIMLQTEVAQRGMALPGDMSVLSVALQLYATVTAVRDVPPSSFFPQPEVNSSVIQVDLRDQPLSAEPTRLLQIAKIGFSGKRKQLLNTLSAGLKLPKQIIEAAVLAADLPVDVRPQMLSVEKWEKLRLAIDGV